MFDMGFLELLVIGIVALLVLGPERLPGAVRTAGLMIGRIKRSFAEVRSQVEREIGADEIRQQLHNERILADLAKSRNKAENTSEDTAAADTPASLDGNAPVTEPGDTAEPGARVSPDDCATTPAKAQPHE
ncbi:MAG: twin-arginine translocase subunit TatB [Gammaproteobacteria bacterium HGW-Gammaproteobacteria-11]|nr:MAG: twin-arginine translocase subunit TatB [Gammaproteobacteria bacterium HGW-Gammaproteobacteria-11]